MVSMRTACLSLCSLAALFHAVSSSCSAVRHAYTQMGFSADNVPENQIAGDRLKVCVQNWTCCSGEMEQNLILRSKHEFIKLVDQATEDLRNTFESRHKRFDDFFLELLEKTERSLNEMFSRTYGDPFTQNADIFQHLFSELKRYYKGENVNLDEMIDDFWIRLMERMFQLLNSQYDINDDYMECVNKQMDDLKPFGDVPKKFKAQVTRAFAIARTFVQGLKFGQDIANTASKVFMSEECIDKATNMLYCVYCDGLVTTKPCKDFCMNVMQCCLQRQIDIDSDWNMYIDHMLLLIKSGLEGPFNIESVMEPIDVKISDAIMNMQDKTMELSYQVFQDCGQPKLLEKSRFSRDITEDLNARFTETDSSGTNLQKLVMDIKEKLTQYKLFWSSLPKSICQGENLAVESGETTCWSGVNSFWNASEETSSTDVKLVDFSWVFNKLFQPYNDPQLPSDDTSNEMSGSGSGSGCMESCVTSSHLLITDEPETESSTSLFHPSCILLCVLSILISLYHHHK